MNQVKVSVIVAVYNAEKTLCRCLDSLKNQTIDSIEFICIDDGSSDASPSILDSYAASDNRFKVYHKHNEGISATRQFGIDHICGEYVIHLDSDDYVDSSAYQLLYEAATSNQASQYADIVICNAYRITAEGYQLMDYSDRDLSAKGLITRMLSWETSALWNRLIKADLIKRYHLSFPNYLQLAEDRFFLTCLLNRSIVQEDSLTIIHLDKPLVYYDNIANPCSLTRPSDSIKDIVSLHVCSYLIMKDEIDMKLFGTPYYSFIASMAFKEYWRIKETDLTEADYLDLFSPFKEGIGQYVPNSMSKYFVLSSLRYGVAKVYPFRWLVFPRILLDKIKLLFSHRFGNTD